MELIAGALLLSSGYYLNQNDKKLRKSNKNENEKQQKGGSAGSNFGHALLGPIGENLGIVGKNSNLTVDQDKIGKSFNLHFYNKRDITNPNFKEESLVKNLTPETIKRIKAQVDLDKVYSEENRNLNDVGFQTANTLGYQTGGGFSSLPSIDDIEKDVKLTHSNMVPFFGSNITQNVHDNGATSQILENYTGNYRTSRRDNKQEVEYLFDPDPNNRNVYGASTEMVTNRDQTRFFPSATGKKHNELPFEQIHVGKGIANGYTARPNGGLQGLGDDVRILPKTTDERRVNPKITYEGRVVAGKAPTEKGKLIGRQTLKKPKAIVWNHNGERNFATTGVHKKNRQRADVIFKSTNRDKLHREYKGGAAPTSKSHNTPDSLRGKKKISHKKNFLNTPHRNLAQVSGKRMNDLGKTSFWNKPTERSMQSTRVHYTNVRDAPKGQQYFSDGTRYTRKQDLISNRPGSRGGMVGGDGSCGVELGKAGPMLATRGPSYDPREIARTTIRETTENNTHDGFLNGSHKRRGPVYDQNETAKTTIRETTEDNRHKGWVGSHKRKGKVYDQNDVARTTIRETTEDNTHDGFLHARRNRGPVYDQNETAKTTIRETTEDNRHKGWVGDHQKKGRVYDQNETARTTIRETTEDNHHKGWVGKSKRKGRVYDQSEVARTTIRETTEDNRYIPSADRGAIQRGGGYSTTNWEAKNPQKAYLCNHEYVGAGEATSNKKPRSYSGEYKVNTNKEQIAIGRSPTEVKNAINLGKESVNINVKKIQSDYEIPHIYGKGTSVGNMYNNFHNLTTRKNITPTQPDRLQADILDQVKFNPLNINQNLN